MRRLVSGIAVPLALCGMALHAQSNVPRDGDRFVSASYGASFVADVGPHFALIRDRRVIQSAVQAEWVWGGNRALAFSSTAEVVAAVVMPRRDGPPNECFEGRTICLPVIRPKMPVAALGATPLGVKVYLAPAAPIRVFAALAGGLIAFDRSTPVVAASAVNFAAEYVAGVEFVRRTGTTVSLGWKFQHWSNGGIAYLNPGLDVNLLYVSFKHRRKPR